MLKVISSSSLRRSSSSSVGSKVPFVTKRMYLKTHLPSGLDHIAKGLVSLSLAIEGRLATQKRHLDSTKFPELFKQRERHRRWHLGMALL